GFSVCEILEGEVAFGPEGRYVHELVVPFLRAQPPSRRSAVRSVPAVERRFAPGSHWLYAKLYSGVAIADEVLRDVVLPLVIRDGFSQAVNRWFFLRYSDPDTHLRLRFCGTPDMLASYVAPMLHAAVARQLTDGRIWRVQLDTYEREVERYGGPDGIEV